MASRANPISEAVAGRDLRLMVEAEYLVPKGEKRGRYYLASEKLTQIRREIALTRDPQDDSDPFELVA